MGKKYRRYKNFVEKYLDSNQGKRFFNIVYSVGAAIVILGAMFKILHLPYGNQMLMIGMITEAIVFLLSAFEKPSKEYKWEEVYPVLSENEDFVPRAEREAMGIQQSRAQENRGPAIQATSVPSSGSGSTSTNTNSPTTSSSSGRSGNVATSGGIQGSQGGGAGTVIIGGGSSQGGDANNTGTTRGGNGGSSLSGNITIVNRGGSTPSSSNNITDISDENVNQIAQMSEQMEKFAKVTESLSKISDSLQTIIGNTDGVDHNTQGYVTQMETLNRNIAGLNTIFEVQLKGVSGQIQTIDHINAGLDRIKNLYDGSLVDSTTFKHETEKMAQQLAELNQVYARMLQAMTTNMNMGGGFNPNLGNIPPTQP